MSCFTLSAAVKIEMDCLKRSSVLPPIVGSRDAE